MSQFAHADLLHRKDKFMQKIPVEEAYKLLEIQNQREGEPLIYQGIEGPVMYAAGQQQQQRQGDNFVSYEDIPPEVFAQMNQRNGHRRRCTSPVAAGGSSSLGPDVLQSSYPHHPSMPMSADPTPQHQYFDAVGQAGMQAVTQQAQQMMGGEQISGDIPLPQPLQ